MILLKVYSEYLIMIVGRLEGLQKDHGKPLSISSDMSAKTLDYYKQKINLSFCDIKILLARRVEMKCVTEQKDLLELLLFCSFCGQEYKVIFSS